MLKREFINDLTKALEGLPEKEKDDRISFYSDMIDDRIEDGMSEEEAVKDIGTVEEIKKQIMSDVSLMKIVKHKMNRKRKLRIGEVIAIIVASPIWLALLLAIIAVVIAVFISLWAVAIGLFAGDVALGIGGIAGGIISMFGAFLKGAVGNGFVLFGFGLIALGLSFICAVGCVYLIKALIKLIRWIILKIKNGLVGGKKNE